MDNIEELPWAKALEEMKESRKAYLEAEWEANQPSLEECAEADAREAHSCIKNRSTYKAVCDFLNEFMLDKIWEKEELAENIINESQKQERFGCGLTRMQTEWVKRWAVDDTEIVNTMELPKVFDTPICRKAFKMAIEAGIMEVKGKGFRRKGISKTLLGYFVGALICGDRISEIGGGMFQYETNRSVFFPGKETDILFNEVDVGKIRGKAIRSNSKVQRYEIIDKIINSSKDGL